jgi:hypothetical protein
MQNTNDMNNEHEAKPGMMTNARSKPAPKDQADHGDSHQASKPNMGHMNLKKSKPKDEADHSGHVPSMPCTGTNDCM